ncbi:hypothetical protein ABW20_dc0100850 [Dactylellina cionopaga]|nr:hypothetical protein ABW20_dc0100850 [Dactylellina cionopaga]
MAFTTGARRFARLVSVAAFAAILLTDPTSSQCFTLNGDPANCYHLPTDSNNFALAQYKDGSDPNCDAGMYASFGPMTYTDTLGQVQVAPPITTSFTVPGDWHGTFRLRAGWQQWIAVETDTPVAYITTVDSTTVVTATTGTPSTSTSTVTLTDQEYYTPSSVVISSTTGYITTYTHPPRSTRTITIPAPPPKVDVDVVLSYRTTAITCFSSHAGRARNVNLFARQASLYPLDPGYELEHCGPVVSQTITNTVVSTSTVTTTDTIEVVVSSTTTSTSTLPVPTSYTNVLGTTTKTLRALTVWQFTRALRQTRTITKTIVCVRTVFPLGPGTPKCTKPPHRLLAKQHGPKPK